MDRVALVLVIIGALNWLLVGLFGYDLVAALLGGSGAISVGQASGISRIVYGVVGIAGAYAISFLFRNRGVRD
ncbi:DUF378 domain-containing protein [Wukongibacter sp. M2B1]|uniref:DUF378 domain-containing protein n=1 Tax=Wukongibacter sp. M2B1 TaxID=3088895 RepID=UPI003D798F7A